MWTTMASLMNKSLKCSSTCSPKTSLGNCRITSWYKRILTRKRWATTWLVATILTISDRYKYLRCFSCLSSLVRLGTRWKCAGEVEKWATRTSRLMRSFSKRKMSTKVNNQESWSYYRPSRPRERAIPSCLTMQSKSKLWRSKRKNRRRGPRASWLWPGSMMSCSASITWIKPGTAPSQINPSLTPRRTQKLSRISHRESLT